jgi:hypothetical protein
VNVQNVQEFPCQVLNRDVWSNSTVKDIVSEHFIFWQIYHDAAEGQRYCQFYNVQDFPHIAIVDPRTGEKMRHWSALDAVVFCEHITEFINEHPSPDGTAVGPAASTSSQASGSKSRRIEADNMYEQSEEDQLKAAIAASLREVQKKARAVDSDDDSDEDIVCLDTEDELEENKTAKSASAVAEKWEDFLGVETEKLSQLIIRFPDGSRQQKDFPSDSKLKVCF